MALSYGIELAFAMSYLYSVLKSPYNLLIKLIYFYFAKKLYFDKTGVIVTQLT